MSNDMQAAVTRSTETPSMPQKTSSTTPRYSTSRARPVENIDTKSDLANVRVRTVADCYGVGIATIWRWASEGRIPAPRKISSGTTVWNVGALRADLAAKAGK
jgi:predicted DNA-binding transcriptional regulator AlpA